MEEKWKKYEDVISEEEYQELVKTAWGNKVGLEIRIPFWFTLALLVVLFFCWLGNSQPIGKHDIIMILGIFGLTIPFWIWGLYKGFHKLDEYIDFSIDCIARARRGEEFAAEINGQIVFDTRPGGAEYEDAQRWKTFFAKNGYLNQA